MDRNVWYFYTHHNHSNINVFYAIWHGVNPRRSKIYKDLNKHLNRDYGTMNGDKKLTGFGYSNDKDKVDDWTSDKYVIPSFLA